MNYRKMSLELSIIDEQWHSAWNIAERCFVVQTAFNCCEKRGAAGRFDEPQVISFSFRGEKM